MEDPLSLIQKLRKPGKRMVVELDDEVEYILDDNAVQQMEAGKSKVALLRVIDRKPIVVNTRRIEWAILKEGVIDYLDLEGA